MLLDKKELMVDFLERLFVGKRVKDFGAVQGSADRINVVVAEVKGKRQLLLRASTPGSLRYVYIDPGDVERLSAMLAEARDLLADESA